MSKEEKTAKPARVAAKPARKAFMEERKRRTAMPMKEMPKEPSPRTVKGKIAAIQTAAGMIYSGARGIQAEFAKQMKENEEFVVLMQTDVERKTKAIQEAAAKVQSGVRAIQAAIGEQAKENQEGLVALQSGVAEQMEENQAYVKDFYG